MAFCRASGHVLVITICHWFPVNADESRDGSIRLSLSLLPCWVVCTLHSALFPCSTLLGLFCPAQSLCVLVLLSCCCPFSFLSTRLLCLLSASLSSSSSLSLSSLRRQAPLGHDILWPVACLVYLRYLAKRGNSSWRSCLPLSLPPPAPLACPLLLSHFYCYDAYFVTPEIETFFPYPFCPFFYSPLIYRIGLRRLHFKLIEYLAKCLSALPSKLFTARRQSILTAVVPSPTSLSPSLYFSLLQKKSQFR